MSKRKTILVKILSICLVLVTFCMTQVTAYAAPPPTYHTVTLTIDYNGGYDPNHPNDTCKIYKGVSGFAIIGSGDIVKTGHSFSGYRNKNTGEFYGTSFSEVFSENTTIVMEWTPNLYTITYNINGGDYGPKFDIKTYGKTLYLDGRAPKKDGYEFTGWKCSADGKIYQPGDAFKLNQDCTMTAQWELGKPVAPSGFITLAEIGEYISALIIFLILSILR